MRVLLISERWETVSDEGMLVFLDRFAHFIKTRDPLLIVHERGSGANDLPLRRLVLGKVLVTPALRECLEDFKPELVLYCPTACATLNALARHSRLSRAAQGTPCALLSLQTRDYPWWQRPLLRFVRPWRLVVLSQAQGRYFTDRGFETLAVRAGVDLTRFRPAQEAERNQIRATFRWPRKKKVILHVGHLRAGRGLDAMKALAGREELHLVLAASTANPADESLERELKQVGIEVHHEYFPRIEDLYRAADLYLFPVRAGSGSIEFPLSVLEAMACNLPVVSTPFGALPESFTAGDGLQYFQAMQDLPAAIFAAMSQPIATRAKVESFSWEAGMEDLMSRLREAMNS